MTALTVRWRMLFKILDNSRRQINDNIVDCLQSLGLAIACFIIVCACTALYDALPSRVLFCFDSDDTTFLLVFWSLSIPSWAVGSSEGLSSRALVGIAWLGCKSYYDLVNEAWRLEVCVEIEHGTICNARAANDLIEGTNVHCLLLDLVPDSMRSQRSMPTLSMLYTSLSSTSSSVSASRVPTTPYQMTMADNSRTSPKGRHDNHLHYR